MNVGIIVYSETGHTYEVIEKLADKLREQHTVTIYRLKYDKAQNIVNGVPYINGHQRLILATPVQGFAPTIPIMEAIRRIENFDGRIVDVLITQYFRFKWLGGKQTINVLIRAIEHAKGVFGVDADIHWQRKDRDQQIQAAIDKFITAYNL
jgi:flavodoxin